MNPESWSFPTRGRIFLVPALTSRFAISGERLAPSGFGASRPKAANDTPDGRALNRRVELVRQ